MCEICRIYIRSYIKSTFHLQLCPHWSSWRHLLADIPVGIQERARQAGSVTKAGQMGGGGMLPGVCSVFFPDIVCWIFPTDVQIVLTYFYFFLAVLHPPPLHTRRDASGGEYYAHVYTKVP